MARANGDDLKTRIELTTVERQISLALISHISICFHSVVDLQEKREKL